jgi:hypothetical protein
LRGRRHDDAAGRAEPAVASEGEAGEPTRRPGGKGRRDLAKADPPVVSHGAAVDGEVEGVGGAAAARHEHGLNAAAKPAVGGPKHLLELRWIVRREDEERGHRRKITTGRAMSLTA